MKKFTLEEIINSEKEKRTESGTFGITACKESILLELKLEDVSLYTLLERYVERANEDVFFNKAMILACWELINDKTA